MTKRKRRWSRPAGDWTVAKIDRALARGGDADWCGFLRTLRALLTETGVGRVALVVREEGGA